jgi:hypothetical protein
MKAHIFSEEENWWTGFLYDKDCQSKIVRRALRPGVASTRNKDPETVAEAREKSRTVVTSNGDDFVRYIKEAQKKDNNKNCEDCWGLVILPNSDLIREYSLERANIKNGIRLGGKLIPWKAVGYVNLCVKVDRGGKVHVARFERCLYCEEAFLIKEDWYQHLSVL